MSASHVIADTLTALGRQQSAIREVTAAELAGATPVGLLTLHPDSGAAIVIEPGATLGGIRIEDYPDPGTGVRPDITIEDSTKATWLSLASAGAAPVSILNEDTNQAAEHRLRCTNAYIPGLYADGSLTQNRLLIIYDHDAQRWIVSWTASSPLSPVFTSSDSAASLFGIGITYTATVSGSLTTEFAIVDDDGTGITIDSTTGIMAGGTLTPAGVYNLVIAAGNLLSDGPALHTVTWTVT